MQKKAVKAITVAELAERWRVSRTIIYELVRQHKLPHFTIGNRIRFSPSAISEYEEAQKSRRPLKRRKLRLREMICSTNASERSGRDEPATESLSV